MATVKMSYNSDVPPPLPPARPPKENQQMTMQRRPLPEIPSGTKPNKTGRPLPNIPTGEQKSQQDHNDRRFSLPHNQHTSPVDDVKGNLSRHLSVDYQLSPVHTLVDSKRRQNLSSPVPPKLPPRKQSVNISPYLHQINNDIHRSISPPVSPRLESQENLRPANSNTHGAYI